MLQLVTIAALCALGGGATVESRWSPAHRNPRDLKRPHETVVPGGAFAAVAAPANPGVTFGKPRWMAVDNRRPPPQWLDSVSASADPLDDDDEGNSEEGQVQINAYLPVQPRRASPAARLEHAMASGPNGTIVLFGGRKNDDGSGVSPSTFGDTWIYLPADTIWQEQQVAIDGDRPVGRSGHTLIAAVSNRTTFLMYAGLVNDEDGLVVKSDLWIMNVDLKSSATWTQVLGTVDGKAWPLGRTQHTAALVDDTTMIIFGGVTLMQNKIGCDPSTVVTEDTVGCWGPTEPGNASIWSGFFDETGTWRWKKHVCHQSSNCNGEKCDCPPVLSEHTMVSHQGSLYVYGGRAWTVYTDPNSGADLTYTATISSELWRLDPETYQWTNLTGEGWIPTGRYEHSAIVLGSGDAAEMHVLYGRVGEDDYPEYAAVAYSFGNASWRNASSTSETVVTEQERPVTRGGQAVTEFETSDVEDITGALAALMFGGECHLTNHLGLPFRDTWNYTADGSGPAYTFQHMSVTDYPQALLSHRAVMVGTGMCIFGGLDLETGFNKDMFCLSYNESVTSDEANSDVVDTLFSWRHKPTFRDNMPSARADFAAGEVVEVNPVDNSSYTFFFISGGRNHYAISIDATPLSDTWVYSMQHFSWFQAVDVNPPSPRMAHSCVAVVPVGADRHQSRSTMLLFGGVAGIAGEYGTNITNELWMCNVSADTSSPGLYDDMTVSASWSRLPNYLNSPSPRAWHTAVALGDLMVVFGGRLSVTKTLNATNEVHIFNISSMSWIANLNITVEHSSTKNPPAPRYAHAAAAVADDRMVILGGFSSAGVLGDVWILTVQQTSSGSLHAQWNQIDEVMGRDSQSLSFGRGYHSLVYDRRSKDLVVFGGTSLQLSDQNDFGTVWTMRAGCNPGQYSAAFARNACTPCPHGSYSDGAGYLTCRKCPSLLTTPRVGSANISNCSICIPSACSSRGTCTVSNDQQVECACGTFYGGSHCEAVAWYWVLGATFVSVLPVLYFLLWHLRRARRTAEALEEENEQSVKVVRDLVGVWQIDPHEITYDRSIGEGQFGSVWAGRFKSMYVAVKKLRTASVPPDFYQELLHSFEQEGSLLVRLHHRNIVHFFGAGYENEGDNKGCPFLVTELAEKGSLAAVLANKGISLSWKERLGAALDAASGMKYLHEREIVHRDLKSFNLLVAHDMTVKVADFGTSVIMDVITRAESDKAGSNRVRPKNSLASLSLPGRRSTSLTSPLRDTESVTETAAAAAGAADGVSEVSPLLMSADAVRVRGTPGDKLSTGVGTLEWMAPELLRAIQDEHHDVESISGPATDVYSFGIVLWEICTRKLPWTDIDQGPFGSKLRTMVIRGERPSVPESVPSRYTTLIEQCWAPDPSLRLPFTDIVQIIAEIQVNRQSVGARGSRANSISSFGMYATLGGNPNDASLDSVN